MADVGPIKVPDSVTDEQALFLSDAVPTGYMGADFCNIRPGDTVAVWGCGGVGLMAQRSALLMGAERVIAIDRLPERLALHLEQHLAAGWHASPAKTLERQFSAFVPPAADAAA